MTDEDMFYATSTEDYHYVKIFKPSADKLLNVLNDMNLNKNNTANLLNDFMNILKELIGYLHGDVKLSMLSNFDEVIHLIHVSEDMLQNMNMELKQ